MYFFLLLIKNKAHDGVFCKCAFILELCVDANNS
jgi:hypothetical protein